MNNEFNSKVKNRITLGEVYVMCNECGARLWSDDALPGETYDRDRSCPYKHNSTLARELGCIQDDTDYY